MLLVDFVIKSSKIIIRSTRVIVFLSDFIIFLLVPSSTFNFLKVSSHRQQH